MRYEGKVYRPPSEAHSYIVQATIGCSHNLCTYCDMYRTVGYRERPIGDVLDDIAEAGRIFRDADKVFVADGDPLGMSVERWTTILDAARDAFPRLRRVSCYATADNVRDKSTDELRTLREHGLSLLYIGPESGDDETLRRIVKGGSFAEHVEAAEKAHAAGMEISVITLLGAGGVERSDIHARETARLVTAMDPEYLASLTLTVIPGTPLARMEEKGRFEMPEVVTLLRELRTIVAESQPQNALFRTNHASNYVPIAGRIPEDREALLATIDAALTGDVPLRPEFMRGL
ncbi:MAG: radical SAM protein [Longimicrobiales bacterium]|nr:radical SAM protein [Longimicrobiales bacterium]